MGENNFMLLSGMDPQPPSPKKNKKKKKNRAGGEAARVSASGLGFELNVVKSDSTPTASKQEALDDGFETVCHDRLLYRPVQAL
jgi:hypothetical protein